MSLSLTSADSDLMRAKFDMLEDGGSADHPLKTEFWGDTFGSLTDKYGMSCMIIILAKKENGGVRE